MERSRRKWLEGVAVSALIAATFIVPVGWAAGARAQQAGADAPASETLDEIEEIVVTAQYRSESIRDVPIAISAYTEDFMRITKLDDVKDLIDFTPGFAGKSKDSFVDTISIRGIVTNDFGVGGDPSVGIFKDGVYQGRTGAAVTSFFDIERAEALRGPQGFLFGRNAISGAISVIVNKPDPDAFGASFQAGFGERAHAEAEAVVNVPLDDGWAIRIASYFFNEDGYVDNFADPAPQDLAAVPKLRRLAARGRRPDLIKSRKEAGRLSIGYRGERFSLTLIGEGEVRDQSGTIYRAIQADPVTSEDLGLVIRGNGRDADTDLGAGTRDDGRIASFTGLIDYDLGFATFSSITGVRTHRYHYKEDFDGTPLVINNYFQDQKGDYYSQEFRLVSNDEGPFTWFAGVSAYREKIDAQFAQQADEELMCEAFEETSCADALDGEFTPSPLGLFETNDGRGRYKGVAAFLDMTYAFTPRFEFNAGVRYTYDRKRFGLRVNPVESDLGPYFAFGYITDPSVNDGFIEDAMSWDQVTPRFTARFHASDDLTLWASVTKGYKSGGFGTFSLDLPTPEQLGFTPAEIQACEDEELGIFCVVNDDGTVPEGTRPSAFAPEKVWSYELGAKGSAFGGRLDFDVNGYYYRYKDLQITFFDDVLLNTLVENVGRVNGLGVEATLRARPDDHWDFLLTAAWSHTSVHRVPETICSGCDGNRLTQNPEWTFGAFAAYYHPLPEGRLAISTELHAQTDFFGGLENLQLTKVQGYADVTLRVAYEADAGWEVAAYVDNLFNDLYYDGSTDAEFPIPSTFFGPSRPRSFGVDFVWRFGGER